MTNFLYFTASYLAEKTATWQRFTRLSKYGISLFLFLISKFPAPPPSILGYLRIKFGTQKSLHGPPAPPKPNGSPIQRLWGLRPTFSNSRNIQTSLHSYQQSTSDTSTPPPLFCFAQSPDSGVCDPHARSRSWRQYTVGSPGGWDDTVPPLYIVRFLSYYTAFRIDQQ